MKRLICLTLALAMLSVPVQAQGIKLGAGVAGGVDIPIAQDTEKQGSIFGLRGLVNVIPFLTIEPNLFFTRYGDPDLTDSDFAGITADLEGSKVTAYGVDATLGTGFGAVGFHPYGIGGIGFYKIKNDQTGEDNTDFGGSLGLGFEIRVAPQIGIDVRGKAIVIPIEGGSKKSAVVLGGLHYYFGI